MEIKLIYLAENSSLLDSILENFICAKIFSCLFDSEYFSAQRKDSLYDFMITFNDFLYFS